MKNQNYNPNISCNVKDCQHNNYNAHCCTLSKISVNCEQQNVTNEHGTCCHSFKCR